MAVQENLTQPSPEPTEREGDDGFNDTRLERDRAPFKVRLYTPGGHDFARKKGVDGKELPVPTEMTLDGLSFLLQHGFSLTPARETSNDPNEPQQPAKKEVTIVVLPEERMNLAERAVGTRVGKHIATLRRRLPAA